MQNAEKEVEEYPRNCKDCGTGIGKSKRRCEPCRAARIKQRRRNQNSKKPPAEFWDARDNFKRDDQGKVLEKLCTTCKKWKEAGEFSKRKDTASGLKSFCKPCERDRTRTQAAKQRELAKYQSPIRFCARIDCGKSFRVSHRNIYCSEECSKIISRDKKRETKGSLHATDHFTCKRCHRTKHIDLFKKPKSTEAFKIAPSVCFECSEKRRKRSSIARNMSPKYRVRRNLSKRLRGIMRSKGRSKGSITTTGVLGCSPGFLRSHIESQFTRGMTWENYGSFWQVDHIQPCALFDHMDDDQVKKCWHFSNLQPLRSEENLAKSDSIVDCQPELMIDMH
jgi:predicted nucleic acid-binding Zn ribbon protein